jgi:phosphatidate cytidylyltransferase
MLQLKQRLLTGFLLTAFVILSIIFLSPLFFAILSLGVTLWASWEWCSLMAFKKQRTRFIYLLSVAATIAVIWYFQFIHFMLWLALVFWMSMPFFILAYPKWSSWWSKGLGPRFIMGLFALIPMWFALNILRYLPQGQILVLFLIAINAAADTGAYFVGQWMGKHQLFPRVSPGKTIEGFWGGLVASLLMGVVGCFIFPLSMPQKIMLLGLVLVTFLLSVEGGGLISMLKRQVGIKDFAHYLPGHGGLLDRLDSFTATTPIFLLGWLILNNL